MTLSTTDRPGAATVAERQFFFFHLMPYQGVPADFLKYRHGQYLTNDIFDPLLGQRLYNDYLDEMEYAEELGFDGVCFNEHHYTAYGLMPTPNLVAAMLARRTKRVKLAILGNIIGLEDKNPIRVAEELAMLDVVSGGRIISGFVRGIGGEFFHTMSDPTRSRERHYEAHDLILKAWTTPGPFSWDSKNYHFRYVNPWPRPMQQPHPPIWVPSSGSAETIDWAARNGYTYLSVYVPLEQMKFWFDEYTRIAAEKYGYEAGEDQRGLMTFVYVDETDEKAMRNARPHFDYFFDRIFGGPSQESFNINQQVPPGYLTESSFRRVVEGMVQGGPSGYSDGAKRFSFDAFYNSSQIYIGSPKTVTEKLQQAIELTQSGVVCSLLQFGDLPKDKCMQSMGLFATEVLPKLRGPLKKMRPAWLGASEATRGATA